MARTGNRRKIMLDNLLRAAKGLALRIHDLYTRFREKAGVFCRSIVGKRL